MKKFIKQKLHEHWAWNDEPKTKSPLAKELEVIGNKIGRASCRERV
mgnify:CR=1 FL=1